MIHAAKDALYVNPGQAHRLVTHEDQRFGHAHKILGIGVLAHFCYRLANWYNHGTLAFAPGSPSTLWLLLLHALLHATSFQFVVPNRRNAVYNIIWPEMRLHSMFFAYRALLVMLVIWLQERNLVPLRWDIWMRGAIVMLTMAAADLVTHAYRGVPTMRNNPWPAYVPRWYAKAHNFFYSLSQLFATLNMLYRGNDLVFLTLIPIQTAPFCMTLEKKGIITQAGWHFWYTVAVGISYAYGLTHLGRGNTVAPLALGLAAARFILGINKYALWAAVIAYHAYNNGGGPDPGYAM